MYWYIHQIDGLYLFTFDDEMCMGGVCIRKLPHSMETTVWKSYYSLLQNILVYTLLQHESLYILIHTSAYQDVNHVLRVLSKPHPRKAIRWIHQRSESLFSTLNMR